MRISKKNRFQLGFPTLLHQQAAEAAQAFFLTRSGVDSILVVNSLARGQGTSESDLDMAVLVYPGLSAEKLSALEEMWLEELAGNETLRQFQASGPHAHVQLDILRGEFTPITWDDGGGPDGFELGIGNLLAYSAPFGGEGRFHKSLQKQWLPFYSENLRRQRQEMARDACLYDLDHVPFFIRRELYFQAFDRLYKSFQEFLQALFITRRVYPLAYNKWIKMQVADWLDQPDLYSALPPILSVSNIESTELVGKARDLANLVQRWVVVD